MTISQKPRIIFAAVLLAGAVMFGGASCSSPHEGKVVDAETDGPISDAFVIGQWSKNGWERTICFHLDMTRSDAFGTYRIPALGITEESWFEDENLTLTAYKKGYRQQWYGADGKFINPEKAGVIRLEKINEETVTPDERIGILREEARQISCRSAGNSRKNVADFYRSLYEEALEHAGGKKTEDMLFLREQVEQYELGYEKASERYRTGLHDLKNIDKPQRIPAVRVIETTDQAARGAVHADDLTKETKGSDTFSAFSVPENVSDPFVRPRP